MALAAATLATSIASVIRAAGTSMRVGALQDCPLLPKQLATPPPTDAHPASIKIQSMIEKSPQVEWVSDPHDVIEDADFVYTDTWINMEHFNAPNRASENEALIEEMLTYQLNESLVRDLDLRIMHDMPIHNHFEITPGLVRDPRSVIFEQAANRLHAQKGLLAFVMGGL